MYCMYLYVCMFIVCLCMYVCMVLGLAGVLESIWSVYREHYLLGGGGTEGEVMDICGFSSESCHIIQYDRTC